MVESDGGVDLSSRKEEGDEDDRLFTFSYDRETKEQSKIEAGTKEIL